MRGFAGEGRHWLQLALDNAAGEQPEPASHWAAIPPGVRARALSAAGALEVTRSGWRFA
jgi:hypothetical protein